MESRLDNYVLDTSQKVSGRLKVYLFSGLGADGRLFQWLETPEGIEFIPLDYIPPQNCRSLREYARLLKSHYAFEEPFILGGVSIGGMIAQELAQITKPKAVILISTAMARSEMPLLFKMARKLPVGFLMNKPFLSAFAKMLDPLTIKSKQGRKLFLDMLDATPAEFMKFGAQAILKWQPPLTSVRTIRIHGTTDRVFPAKKISNAQMIKGGNHFMVFEKAKEISEVIQRELSLTE